MLEVAVGASVNTVAGNVKRGIELNGFPEIHPSVNGSSLAHDWKIFNSSRRKESQEVVKSVSFCPQHSLDRLRRGIHNSFAYNVFTNFKIWKHN